MDSVSSWGNTSLEQVDPEIHDLIEKEKRRQCRGIELIVSENFTFAVIEALRSDLTNKDSERMPDNFGFRTFTTAVTSTSTRSRTFAAPALSSASTLTTPSGASMSSLTPVAPPTTPPTPPSSILMTALGRGCNFDQCRARAALHSDREDRLNADNKLTVTSYQAELAKRLDCLCVSFYAPTR